MPKRTRRGKGKHKRSVKLRQLKAREVEQQVKPAPILSKPATLAKPSVIEAEVSTRYQYVIVELKRIGIIAGAMFLLLIVLSFFLR